VMLESQARPIEDEAAVASVVLSPAS